MQQNALLEGLRKLVRGTVHRIGSTLPSEDRKDVEQEAMLDLYVHLQRNLERDASTAKTSDTHAGLAVMLARYRTLDALRKQKRPLNRATTGLMGPQAEDEFLLDTILEESLHTKASPTPLDTVLQREMVEHLVRHLDTRDLMLLSQVSAGYTAREIAERNGLDPTKISSLVQDWKKKCRKILSKYDDALAAGTTRVVKNGDGTEKTREQKREE